MRAALRFLPFLLIMPAGSVPIVEQFFGAAQNASPQDARAVKDELDRLFYTLRHSETAEDASKAEANIFIVLTQSSSPTANLLLESANVALENGDEVAAKAMLDNVVRLEPKFAEGLTRAAALAYQGGDSQAAKALLTRALRLEPRHFGALSGLGLVLEDLGDLKNAQRAYHDALYFHPFLDSAKRGLIRLEAKTDGLSL